MPKKKMNYIYYGPAPQGVAFLVGRAPGERLQTSNRRRQPCAVRARNQPILAAMQYLKHLNHLSENKYGATFLKQACAPTVLQHTQHDCSNAVTTKAPFDPVACSASLLGRIQKRSIKKRSCQSRTYDKQGLETVVLCGFLDRSPAAFFAGTSGFDTLEPRRLDIVLKALSPPLPELRSPQEQQPSSNWPDLGMVPFHKKPRHA